MSDPVLRALYGEMIDSLALRCEAHALQADLVADVERMVRFAESEPSLRHKVILAIETLLMTRIDNDADGFYLTSVLESLGGVKDSSALAPATNRLKLEIASTANAWGDLEPIGTLCANAPTLASPNIYVPADYLRREGSTGAWIAVPEDLATGLFSRINAIDARWSVDIATTTVWVGRLPFYDDVQLLRVFDPLWVLEDLVVHYLIRGNNIFRLNGTSPPIHEVNATSLKLNRENVLDYLRFFCFFVRGEEGAFYVSETEGDPMLSPHGEGNTAPEILPHLQPAKIIETFDSSFKVEAKLIYANAFFASTLIVQPTGMVEMLDDDPIVANLPFRLRSKLS